MLVRMLKGITGNRDGVEWPPVGGTVDLPDDEAAGMIAHGYCTPAADVEEAAVEPAETAVAEPTESADAGPSETADAGPKSKRA